MKKTLVLSGMLMLLLFSVSIRSYAQFQKGQLLLDGNLSFSNSSSSTLDSVYSNVQKSNSFSFNASVGKFISTNTVYGVGINYSLSINDITNSSSAFVLVNNENKSTLQSIGLLFYARRYFTLAKNLYAFGEVALTPSYRFGTVNASIDYPVQDSVVNSQETLNGFSVTASLIPGLSYQLNHRLLVNATLPSLISINYSHMASKGPSSFQSTTNNNFNLSSGLSSGLLSNIGIGFSWLLHS